MATNPANNSSPGQINTAAAVLWASAFLIAAMVIVQAGRLGGLSGVAHADMAISRSHYTLLTTDSGRGGETAQHKLLYVIDSREQVLLVYEVEDARRQVMHLRDGWNIDAQFRAARQQ